jgi:hypothetical protein
MCNGTSFTFFGTNNSRVYYSTNMGTNWSSFTVPSLINVASIHVISCNSPSSFVGYFGGGQNIVFTSNSGTNWLVSPNAPGAGTISSIVACPIIVAQFGNHDVFITKGDNNLYRIPSNFWMIGYTAPSGNYRYISNQLYDWYTYAVRDNGGISWGSCGTGGITRISEVVPTDFTLSQNYPNPFNPVTKIEFDVPVSGNVRLSVFDALGREISRAVDQTLIPGKYMYEWDAANYPSGVYFYSLLAGDFSQTKKMMVIK